MSDKTTALMARDRLIGLIHATAEPAAMVTPYTIPRTRIVKRKTGPDMRVEEAAAEMTSRTAAASSVSPVTVLFVIGMLVVLFAAIIATVH